MPGPDTITLHGAQTIRCLVVSDHALSRCGLRALLEGQAGLEVVAEAAGSCEAVQALARHRVDVVVLDTVHACKQPRQLTARLVAETPNVAVLIVANHLCSCSHWAFTAGARGLVLKDAGPVQLAAAVWSVASGSAVMPAGMVRRIGNGRSSRTSPHLSKLNALSGRERDVLRCIVAGSTNAEIAERLHLSEGTVKSHVQHVLNKLNLRDRVQAVIYAYETGFVASSGQDSPPGAPGATVTALPVAAASKAAPGRLTAGGH